eukprot:PhM_4_TR11628/c1_g1_i1/m.57264
MRRAVVSPTSTLAFTMSHSELSVPSSSTISPTTTGTFWEDVPTKPTCTTPVPTQMRTPGNDPRTILWWKAMAAMAAVCSCDGHVLNAFHEHRMCVGVVVTMAPSHWSIVSMHVLTKRWHMVCIAFDSASSSPLLAFFCFTYVSHGRRISRRLAVKRRNPVSFRRCTRWFLRSDSTLARRSSCIGPDDDECGEAASGLRVGESGLDFGDPNNDVDDECAVAATSVPTTDSSTSSTFSTTQLELLRRTSSGVRRFGDVSEEPIVTMATSTPSACCSPSGSVPGSSSSLVRMCAGRKGRYRSMFEMIWPKAWARSSSSPAAVASSSTSWAFCVS